MSIGLLALLDDIAALVRISAASLDDVAGQAAKAGVKAAGVVIDDAAVTPRYVVGMRAERELPVIAKIARGSLRNKLVYLLPIALALSAFAPAAILPLLMLGGAFLCYEGAEKVYEAVRPHQAKAHEADLEPLAIGTASQEDAKVASAIKTDFILSAEIMAITLASIPPGSIWMQAVVLAAVGIAITAWVYGGVALIVKADDVGMALARTGWKTHTGALIRAMGRGLVRVMPPFLGLLSVVGTAAMIWVGGGIVIHGIAHFGLGGLDHAIQAAADGAARAVPVLAGFANWLVFAAGSGLVGLGLGLVLIPINGRILSPAWRRLKSMMGRHWPAALPREKA